ncbi:MAG: HD domain-containing protein [Sedimentisphaerales bacterium]|nr:HD domain-containing protein [Sedimentisphaerales bacterium]
MKKEQLEKIKEWFDEYVAGFYGDDEYFNANIELKDRHSRLVCAESLYLADELGLTDEQKQIAEVIAILHDVGRFVQFERYRTYNDPRSVNHSLLGVKIIREHNVLANLTAGEAEIIEVAIKYHGDKQLPDNLSGEVFLQSRIIRDADKIDIYRVVTECYEQYENDPDSFKLEIELPDEPWYSDEVLQKILTGRRIDYRDLKTLNDMKLIQLSWVYDVNFAATYNRIRERRFLEKIIDFLPPNDDIKQVAKTVLEYVDRKIKQG